MCPNINSKEWKDLVAQHGEAKAYLIFSANFPENIPAVPARPDLKNKLDALYDNLGSAFFRTSYETRGFTDTSKETVVAYLYDKFRTVRGIPTELGIKADTFIPYLSTDNSFTSSSKNNVQLIAVLEKLSDKFGIPYEIRRGTDYKGKYENVGGVKKVIINPDLATKDTPFHEFFHPFVRLVKTEQAGLFEELAKEAAKVLPKMEAEEAVTEMLGRLASNTTFSAPILRKFLAFVSELLFKLTGKHYNFKKNNKLQDVVDFILEQKTIDITREETLLEAFQAIEAIDESVGLRVEKSTSEDLLKALVDAAVDLSTNDSTNFYQRNGADVAKRATVFVSSYTEGEFNSRKKDQVKTSGYYRAVKAFSQFKMGDNQKIKYGSLELTFDELVEAFNLEENRHTLYGKMVHAYLEYRLSDNPLGKDKAKANFIVYANRYGEPFQNFETHPTVKFLEKEFLNIVAASGLRKSFDPAKKILREDRFNTEVTLLSTLLKDKEGNPLGSTADLVIQHENGDLSLVDYKTGFITSDVMTMAFLKFGDDFNVRDSKLSRAKLELTIRAIMIKEAHPDAKFNFLRVLKVDKLGYHEAFDTELNAYLGVVGAYYKKNNPETYKALKEKGLLDSKQYYGSSESSREYLDNFVNSKKFHALSFREQREYLITQIRNLNQNLKDSEDKEFITQAINSLTKVLLEVEGFSKEEINFESPDIALPKALFGSLSDVDNRSIQGLNKFITEASHNENREWNGIEKQFNEKLLAVAKENTTRGEFTKINMVLTGTIAAGVVTFNPLFVGGALLVGYILRKKQATAKSYFGFMYSQSTDASRPGVFLNTTDRHPTLNRDLTIAEKDFRDFYVKTTHSLYSEVMDRDAFFSNVRRRNVMKYELAGLPKQLPPDFFARVPITFDEAKEHVDANKRFGGIKASAQYLVRNSTTSLLERSLGQTEDTTGVRLKYYSHAGQEVVASEDHSFDPQQHFTSFVKNLLHKKHFDDVYPVAKGVQSLIKSAKNERGEEKLTNLIKFVDNQIAIQILRQNKDVKFRTSPIKVSVNESIGKYLNVKSGVYEISQDKLLRMMKYGVSFTGMAFNLVGAVFNTTIITITNAHQATINTVGKLTGLTPDKEISKTTSLAGWKEFGVYLKDTMTGNADNNKLAQMAKHFNWMPENYGYGPAKQDSIMNIQAPGLNSTAFLFHNMTENYGALTHLAILAKGTYVTKEDGTSVSIWDAYSMKDGELTWTAGKRGLTTQGEALKELDFMEVKALHRIYEKMHGGYRPSEKTAIEATVIGEFVTQFSKYFYTYVKNLYQSPYRDSTDGWYAVKGVKPDGTNIWEWEEKLNVGRMNVFMGGIMALTKGNFKTYLDSSSPEGKGRRQRFAELVNTGVWMAILFAVYAMMLDDDEEDTMLGKRSWSIWKDTSQGLWPQDIMDKVAKPVVILDRAVKTGKSFHTAFTAKRESDRERAWKSFIPGASTADKLSDLFGQVKDEEGKVFGIFNPTITR